jgi:plastocyanin
VRASSPVVPIGSSLRLGNDSRRAALSRQVRALIAIAILALSLTAVAGCGGGDDNEASTTATTSTTDTSTAPSTETSTTPSGGSGGTTLKVDAAPSGALEFTKTSLQAKAGKVTIEMGNPSPVDHAVGIKGNGIDADGNTVGKGGVSKVTASLKAGTYEFYCPVDAHEEAGMKGTLTVK